MRDADQFGEKGREPFWGKAGLKEVHSVVDRDFLIQFGVDKRRDVVLDLQHNVTGLIGFFLNNKVMLGLDVIVAFLFLDHFELFNFLLFAVLAFFSLLFRVFEGWTGFLLGLGGLWDFLGAGVDGFGFLLFYLDFEEVEYFVGFGEFCLAEDELNGGVDFPVVNEKVSAFAGFFLFPFEIVLEGHGHAPKTLRLNAVDAEQAHKRVVELQPPVIFCLDIRNVVAWLCISNVDDNAGQFILELTQVLRVFLRWLLSVKMLQSVRVNVQIHWELVFGRDLFVDKCV